jgi:hypothetical protein
MPPSLMKCNERGHKQWVTVRPRSETVEPTEVGGPGGG